MVSSSYAAFLVSLLFLLSMTSRARLNLNCLGTIVGYPAPCLHITPGILLGFHSSAFSVVQWSFRWHCAQQHSRCWCRRSYIHRQFRLWSENKKYFSTSKLQTWKDSSRTTKRALYNIKVKISQIFWRAYNINHFVFFLLFFFFRFFFLFLQDKFRNFFTQICRCTKCIKYWSYIPDLELTSFFHKCEVALHSLICFLIRLVFLQHLNSYIVYAGSPPEPSNHTRGQFLHLPSYPLLRLLWSKFENKVTKKRILDQYHTALHLAQPHYASITNHGHHTWHHICNLPQ